MSLAVASLLSAGAASAQSLAGVNTRLVSPLNSQTATEGQTVTVKLDGAVKTADGVKLTRGTELVGKITSVKPSQNGGPASVTLTFTTAELKSGKHLPVKATLLAAYPGDQGIEAQYSNSTMNAVARTVSAAQTIDQEPGALPGVALKSAVEAPESGTFSKTDGNFKLAAGTFLQVGIAPAANGGSTSAAE
ncbi:MAG TPA: hypothetical protein VIY53_05415 [Acidobacteriaceae bacterium]